jgi:hypothetical protein
VFLLEEKHSHSSSKCVTELGKWTTSISENHQANIFNFVGNKVTCNTHKNLIGGRRKTLREICCVIDNCRITRSVYIYTGFELAITNCCPCICPNQQGTTSSIEHTWAHWLPVCTWSNQSSLPYVMIYVVSLLAMIYCNLSITKVLITIQRNLAKQKPIAKQDTNQNERTLHPWTIN